MFRPILLAHTGVAYFLLVALCACGATPAAAPGTATNADRTAASTVAAPAAEAAEATAVPPAPEALATSTIADATAVASETADPATTTTAADGTTLTIFAASSLTHAFGEIGRTFEAQHPGVAVVFNFGASNQLAQGINEGAPADVFASANTKQMDAVIEAGQVIPGTERTFVRNRLVVIYPSENPASLRSLQDLAKPGIKLVLAPKEVPAGQYALDFLAKASQIPPYTATFSETVVANVVSYEENVRAVLSKVSLGEADAGIVYTSDVAGEAGQEVGRIDIPDELNTIAEYPIAPVEGSPNAGLAQEFVAYVVSPPAQETLARYGFIPTTGNAREE